MYVMLISGKFNYQHSSHQKTLPFDNLNHTNRNSLSEKDCANDTAVVMDLEECDKGD